MKHNNYFYSLCKKKSTGFITSILALVLLSGTAAKAQTYCVPDYSNGTGSGDFISQVEIVGTALNSTSTGAGFPYHTIFPNTGSTTATLTPGLDYTFNVAGGTYGTCFVTAWGDWNQNGTFEQNEYIGTSPNVGNVTLASFSNSLTVPFSAIPGTTTIRLRSSDGSPGPLDTEACGATNSGYGETEDYQVTILALNPCTGAPVVGDATSSSLNICPNTPFTLGLVNNTADGGVEYQWQSSADNSAWTNIGTPGMSWVYNVSGITADTYYRCIATCTSAAASSTSTAVFVQVNSFVNCYCTPQYMDCGNSSNFNSANFLSVSDPSLTCAAGSGYSDRTFMGTPTFTAGNSFNFNFTVSNGNNGDGIVGAWIDEDHSGTFDSWEYKYVSYISGGGPYSGSINVPYTATPGVTRMRVKYESSFSVITTQDPCLTDNYYGHVLDYSIDLAAAPSCSGVPNGGTAIANPSLVCVGTPITLNLFGNDAVSGMTYQWQSSPDNSIWTNLGSVQNIVPYSITSQSATTYYRCIQTCVSTGSVATSNAANVIQQPIANCYCGPGTIDCTNANITDLGFAAFTETVACNGGGYTNNTGNPAIAVNAGQAYTFTANINSSTGDLCHMKLWIDDNQDGIFDNNEESIIGAVMNGTISALIPIPVNSVNGQTRMRVKMESYYGSSHPIYACTDNAGTGQTVDYLLDITAAPACSGTPNPGDATASSMSVCPNTSIDLNLTNNTLVSDATYQWKYSTDNVNWFNLGSSQNDIPYTVTSQTATTYYQCVVTCPTSALSSTSTPVMVTQNALISCYCVPPPGNCSSGVDITNVEFVTINNASGCGTDAYENFTGTVASATVAAGLSYSLTVTTSTEFSKYAYAWIDFDRDGSFESSEYTYLGSSGGTGVFTIGNNVNIPMSATPGVTAMRVRLTEYQTLDPFKACDPPGGGAKSPNPLLPLYDGETEDYLVTILPPDCSVLNIPPGVDVTISEDTVCSGSATILDISPSMPYGSGFTYQWSSSPTGLAGSFSPIGSPIVSSSLTVNPTFAQFYMCDVLCNTNPATSSDSIKVIVSSMVTSITSSNINCFGANDGSATMNVSGGVSPFSYVWTPGTFTTQTVTNLSSGTYNCTVTDDIGCTSTQTVTITEPTAIVATITSTNVTCNGLTDGSASVSVTGGTPSYTYLWLPSTGTNSTESGLAAGVYSCSITDANACVITETVMITEPAALTATTSQTNVSCFGGNNGVASVTPAGGTPTYGYFWSHGFGSLPGNTITGNVTAQSYTCTITDANNCTYDAVVTITEPAQITLNVTGNTNTCQTSISGYSVTATNAVGALTYTWMAQPSGTTKYSAVFNYTAAAAGTETIYVSVTDANGCTENSTGLQVTTAPSTNISGTVLNLSTAAPVTGSVTLYKYEPFFTKFDSIDTKTLDAAGNYTFTGAHYGDYIVKAVPVTGSLQVTYGTSSVNWKTATILNHGCAANDVQNINAVPLATVTTGGLGELSGQIREGDGFGKRVGAAMAPLAPGNPIGGIIVKGGKNPGGTMFVQTTTDSNGNYTLSGLPVNSGDQFFILVDIPGLDTNSTYRRYLTSTNSIYTGLDFIVDSMKITPLENAVGINEISQIENQVKVFPNPAKNKFTVNYSLNSESVVSITLYDLLGKEVKAILPESVQPKNEYSNTVELNAITSGMYFVKLRINNSESTIKLFITD